MRDALARDRLVRAIVPAVRRLSLDLRGLTVVTECATGAFACTPVLAGAAGARVIAFGRDGNHGTFGEAAEAVRALWSALALPGAPTLVDSADDLLGHLGSADVVTNSGHLRPLDARRVARLRAGAVIPLMYEAWECREGEIDLAACQAQDVAVAGTNEHHPAVDVFGYLGPLAVKLLLDAGLEVRGNRILLACDNAFGPPIVSALTALGAVVVGSAAGEDVDAAILATTPARSRGGRPAPAPVLPPRLPVCIQLWGDVDRAGVQTRWIPERPPAPGHMGADFSALGPEPVVRLQAGGLKVGERLARARRQGATAEEALFALEAEGWGQRVAVAPPSGSPPRSAS